MERAKTFSERLLKETQPILNSLASPRYTKVLAERLKADLLGETPATGWLPLKKESDRERYLHGVFTEYLEIDNSLERIELTSKYISRVPSHVGKLKYVQYHYEYYLNELYIFNLRVNHFLNFLIRKCEKLNFKNEIPKINNIKKAVNTDMGGYIKVRGRHVHVRRHESAKLSQLASLDMLSKNFDFIRDYRDWELKLLRKEIESEILGNHKALKDFIQNDLYKHLGHLIFTKLKMAHKGHRR